jgi:hypothetical protein
VAVGGQFNGNETAGTQRTYNNLELEAIFTDPAAFAAGDFMPPSIISARSRQLAGGLEFIVGASDFESGLKKVLVTFLVPNGQGGGSWQSIELEEVPSGSGLWKNLQLQPDLTEETLFFVQALTTPVTCWNTNGGVYFKGTPPNPVTNEVGESHKFVVTTWFDEGFGGDFQPAEGVFPLVTLTHSAGLNMINILDNTCPDGTELVLNQAGDTYAQCFVEFNSFVPGEITAEAYGQFLYQTLVIERYTDGLIGNSANAVKTYVDAQISIAHQSSENVNAVNEQRSAHVCGYSGSRR